MRHKRLAVTFVVKAIWLPWPWPACATSISGQNVHVRRRFCARMDICGLATAGATGSGIALHCRSGTTKGQRWWMKNQLERIGALPSTSLGPQWQEAAASCHSSHLGLPPRAFPAGFGNHTGQAGGVRMDLRWHCHSKLRPSSCPSNDRTRHRRCHSTHCEAVECERVMRCGTRLRPRGQACTSSCFSSK